MDSTNKNPIFVEYYSHERANCFKIRNPWTQYRAETIVLCKESEGIAEARKIAKRVLNEWLDDALNQPFGTEPEPV
jgi:hypothetical protein